MQPSHLTVADVTYEQLAGSIDHSLLRPELIMSQIDEGCDLAALYEVASVCARPADVSRCVARLSSSAVAVGTVIGFPHGATTTATKVFESEQAMGDGATELDMVINIGWLRSGEDARAEEDIRAVVDVAGDAAIVKVILENHYLTDDEKTRGCRLVESAGAHYVKTSTGFAETGATLEDLRLMRATVGSHVKVKAAQGVRTLDSLLAVIEAGCDRVGATATAAMLDDYRSRTGG
ncbi:deoxyribose-phosphate aldolase [soil metagenome]